MNSKLILLVISCSFLLSQKSRDFYHTYTNESYFYTITLPENILVREFDAKRALLMKGTNIRVANNTFLELCVMPLDLPKEIGISSKDSMVLTAINYCVESSFGDGPDNSTSCKPTNKITFGKTKSGLRFVKFYLRRYDEDYQYNKSSNSIVGPFYGVNISSSKGKYVLIIKDGGYLLPEVNDQKLQWQIVNSLDLKK